MDFQRIEVASGAGIGSKEELEVDFKKLKQIKNRMRRTDWLFLNACVGEFPEYDFIYGFAHSACFPRVFQCCEGGNKSTE